MPVSRPYWPLTPHSWIDYNVMKITGLWHPAAMALDVTGRTPIPPAEYGFQRITALPAGGMVGQVYGLGGIVATETTAPGTLFEDEDPNGLGERSGNGYTVCVPSCLILPNDLTVGAFINTASEVWSTDPAGKMTKAAAAFNSRNCVRYQGPAGQYPDTVIIGYWERPEVAAFADSAVYNYMFARDIGLVGFWYGIIPAGGNILTWGYEYYAVGWGGQ